MSLESAVTALYFPHLATDEFRDIARSAGSDHNEYGGVQRYCFIAYKHRGEYRCRQHVKDGFYCSAHGPTNAMGSLEWFNNGRIMVPGDDCRVIGGTLEGKSTWSGTNGSATESCEVSFNSGMLHGQCSVVKGSGWFTGLLSEPLLTPPPFNMVVPKEHLLGWWFFNNRCKGDQPEFMKRMDQFCVDVRSLVSVHILTHLATIVAAYLDQR